MMLDPFDVFILFIRWYNMGTVVWWCYYCAIIMLLMIDEVLFVVVSMMVANFHHSQWTALLTKSARHPPLDPSTPPLHFPAHTQNTHKLQKQTFHNQQHQHETEMK